MSVEHSGPEEENDARPTTVNKDRKPYTLGKRRVYWTDEEHERFLDAIQRFGRDWKKVEAFVGTKTTVQIRSHAQKYFIRAQKMDGQFVVPPPRPRKALPHMDSSVQPASEPQSVSMSPRSPMTLEDVDSEIPAEAAWTLDTAPGSTAPASTAPATPTLRPSEADEEALFALLALADTPVLGPMPTLEEPAPAPLPPSRPWTSAVVSGSTVALWGNKGMADEMCEVLRRDDGIQRVNWSVDQTVCFLTYATGDEAQAAYTRLRPTRPYSRGRLSVAVAADQAQAAASHKRREREAQAEAEEGKRKLASSDSTESPEPKRACSQNTVCVA